MFSQTTIIGRMTREPELKYSQSGKAFIRFGVACDRLSNGEKVADFFDVTAFDKSAEFIGEHGYKGCIVFVEGRMESTTQEKEGRQVKYWNLIASRILKLSWKDDNANASAPAGSGTPQQQGQRHQSSAGKPATSRGDYDPRVDPNSPEYDPNFDPWADEPITDAEKAHAQKSAAPAPAAPARKTPAEDW